MYGGTTMYIPVEVDRALFTEEQIQKRVKELGETLCTEYADKNPLFLCVLKGASVFFCDLIRNMECPVEIDFIKASSYCGTDSTGEVKLDMSAVPELAGREVVIVEDILDTARTLSLLKAELLKMNPASLKVVCMLDKPSRRVVKGFKADLVGFEIEDLFVVGYGLDCDQKFRNLPYIGIYKT